MTVIETPGEMRAWALEARAAGKTIGFVPTMGALHEGHASLMRRAAAENDIGVASIFVNPTQFAPTEDFGKYPRTWNADLELAASCGISVIYAPGAAAMYPEGYATYVQVERVTEGLCSRTRPHFFRGVATVCTKLFNAVLPHRAYFGQKDAQQCAVIRRMVRDLDMGFDVVEMPIIREADGLAMSSRNRYLNDEERRRALCLSQSLFAAEALLQGGERRASVIVERVLQGLTEARVDYVELVDAMDFQPVDTVEGPVVLAVAAFVGDTRLIDNIKFTPAGERVSQ